MNLDLIIELAMKRASQAQVTTSQGEGSDVTYENNKLKTAMSYQSSATTLRVIVDGKLGVAARSGDVDPQELVRDALEVAEFGSDAPFEWPGPQDMPEVKLVDDRVTGISKQQMVDWGGEMLAAVLDYNADIVADASVSANRGVSTLANSAGLRVHAEGTRLHMGVGGMLTRGTDMLMAHQSDSWRAVGMDAAAVAARAVEKFRLAERTAAVESKVMPVIFTPAATHILLLALTLGINGKNVLKGDSPLKDKLGQPIADERITIIDDPLIDYALDSGPFDREGVAHHTLPVVERGALKCFLYDLKTAAKAGAQTTGHGPGCRTTNLVISAGDAPYEQMIADTDEGIIVENVMGLGQGNAISGEFSVNMLLAYKIEKGQIVGRVKDAMLAGNAYDALRGIACLSSDREWVHGSLLAPAIKVEGLSVVAQ